MVESTALKWYLFKIWPFWRWHCWNLTSTSSPRSRFWAYFSASSIKIIFWFRSIHFAPGDHTFYIEFELYFKLSPATSRTVSKGGWKWKLNYTDPLFGSVGDENLYFGAGISLFVKSCRICAPWIAISFSSRIISNSEPFYVFMVKSGPDDFILPPSSALSFFQWTVQRPRSWCHLSGFWVFCSNSGFTSSIDGTYII